MMKKLKDTKFVEKLEQSESLKKLKRTKFMKKFMKTWFYSVVRYRILPHVYSFWLPWTLLGLMLLIAKINIPWKLSWLSLLMILFVLALLLSSMNIIHGLIGTRGNIRMFFGMFFVINVMFYAIYYNVFFKNAGITYDVSQPHVEFSIFRCSKYADAVMVEHNEKKQFFDENGGLIIVIRSEQNESKERADKKCEYLPANIVDTSHFYHRIRREWVLQNTILTSLMQEPTEFYSFTCTYSGDHLAVDQNYKMARGFHWFLVFHILISWIFLGVFISLIYQKFRNN